MRGLPVATFSDREKAEAVRKQLEEMGVPARVADESILQRFWFVSKPLGAEKVVVEEKDFERAMQALAAAEAKDHQLMQGAIKCPQCGSSNVQYPQFTRKFMTTTMVEVLCLLHMMDKEFYCEQCHYTWPAKEVLRAKSDILNWPDKDKGLVKKEKGVPG